MKYLIILLSVIATLLIAIYTLAFTSFGNKLLKPYIQEQIQTQSGLDITLDTFYLRIDELQVILAIDPKNKVSLQGSFSLLSQSFNLNYKVDAKDLSSLSTLAQMPLVGNFFTSGTIQGDLDNIKIKGQSDIASSDTLYEVKLLSFEPQSVLASIDGLDLSELLAMLGQGAYASSRLDIILSLTSLDPKNLQGDAKITLKDGKINTQVMQSLYNVSIPETNFHSTSQIKLQGEDVIYTTEFISNLASITSKGNIKPETLDMDLDYDIGITELALLKPLTKTDLRGAFHLRGDLKGDKKHLLVNGISDLAGSDTVFQATLKEFAPYKIHAKIKDLQLNKALYMLHQPHYLDALFSAEIKIDNAQIGDLAGSIDAHVKNGTIDTKTFKKLYDITLPSTTFSSNSHVTLKAKTLQYSTNLLSNLTSFSSTGKIQPDTLIMDLIYDLKIKELALLQPITQTDLRGALNLKGEVKGDKEKLTINGISDIAGSDTTFQAILKEFVPASVHASIKNMDLKKLLYMAHQPHYSDGYFTMDLALKNAKMGELDGTVNTKVTKGVLNTVLLTKEMEFASAMPATSYTLSTTSQLQGDLVDSKITLDSTLAKLNIQSALFNIKDSSLKSDYTAHIKSLDQLFFVTQQRMRGAITADGRVTKDKDLDATMHTKIAGGTIDVNLHNDDLKATISSLQTLDLLHILYYPEILKSALSATLQYNLAHSSGELKGKLSEGKFTQNEMLTLLQKYAKIDLYKEKFMGDLLANIKQENIVASLDLRSNTSAITSKNTKINSKTKKIDSTITIVANKQAIVTTLKGDLNAPKVGIDLQKLMETKAGEKIKKEAQRGAKKLLEKLF